MMQLSFLIIFISYFCYMVRVGYNIIDSMLKSLHEVFNQKQMESLRGKMWWVADRQKPFLIKFSLHEDFILIQLTDLNCLWANKFHIKTLLQQKNQYARSLEIKQDRDLLLLFQGLLSASDPQAVYQFSEPKGSQINFTFNKRINIFDFKWTLKLFKLQCRPVQLICREILNPLAATLEAQTKRIEMLRKKFELIEKDYMRKMSQMQKALYKSPLVQDLQDWKLLLPKYQNKLLNFIKFDQAGKFFYKSYLTQEKKQKIVEQMAVFSDERKNKAIARVMNNDVFEMAQFELNKQLQRQRSKMKRQKKIDFI